MLAIEQKLRLQDLAGTIPLAFDTEVREGRPYDCGLWPDHPQHTCLGIIEVNSACNMDCPLCFSEARPVFSLTLDEVDSMLDDYVCAANETSPRSAKYALRSSSR